MGGIFDRSSLGAFVRSDLGARNKGVVAESNVQILNVALDFSTQVLIDTNHPIWSQFGISVLSTGNAGWYEYADSIRLINHGPIVCDGIESTSQFPVGDIPGGPRYEAFVRIMGRIFDACSNYRYVPLAIVTSLSQAGTLAVYYGATWQVFGDARIGQQHLDLQSHELTSGLPNPFAHNPQPPSTVIDFQNLSAVLGTTIVTAANPANQPLINHLNGKRAFGLYGRGVAMAPGFSQLISGAGELSRQWYSNLIGYDLQYV